MVRCSSMASMLLVLSAALGCAEAGEPSAHGEARSAVIYGQDDREEPCAYPVGSPIHEWARSSAMEVPLAKLVPATDGGFSLAVEGTLSDTMSSNGTPPCPEERFLDEPILGGVCSAFLAAPDAVITAGHCIGAPGVCAGVAFVFGAGYDVQGSDPGRLARQDVYFCREVAKVTAGPHGDYALVRLDRQVTGRAPLPLRRSGAVAGDETLVLIGNPMGLPTKIASHGQVLDNTSAYFFKASTDSYGGGSGSAVIGLGSGLVEGILVRGETDFVARGDCWVSKVCPAGGSPCRGEDVSRAPDFARWVQ